MLAFWRIPYLINFLTFFSLLTTKPFVTDEETPFFSPAFTFTLSLFFLSLLLLLFPSHIDPVTIKAYSLLLSILSLLPLLFFDFYTGLVLTLAFVVPNILYFRYLMFIPNVSEIIEGELYLGNIKSAQEENVKKLGITHIVEIHDKYRNTERVPGVEYLSLDFVDRNFVDIVPELHKTTKFIQDSLSKNKSREEERESVVLVHCSAGVSRSASIVMGYLIATRNISVDDALEIVREKRSHVEPNCGFFDCLRRYEVELKK